MKENCEKTTLPNGLRVLTERIPQFPSASIGIWVDVGSADEDSTTEGCSHFLEHLMFKGTPTRSAKEIAEIMDGIGGNLNAFTEKEQTCFYGKVMDKHVPIAMEILGDMLLNSTFPEDEMEKEKGVILEEIKMYEDAPDELIFDLMAQAAWKDHPLGRPILGTTESIVSLSRDTLKKFVSRFYSPDKTIVSVAGKVKHDAMVEMVQKYLPFPDGASESKPPMSPPRFTPSHLVKQKDIEQIHFCLGVNGIPQRDERRYAFSLLDIIVGGSVSSRLFQEIREKRGLVYTISTYQGSYADSAIFGVYGASSPANLETVMKLVLEILSHVRDKGVTSKELHTAKEHLKGSLSLTFESSSNRMIRLAKNEVYHNRFVPHKEVLKRIQSVNLDEMRSLSRDLLDLGACTWAVLGPVSDGLRFGE